MVGSPEVLARVGYGTRGLTFVFLGGPAIVAVLSERIRLIGRIGFAAKGVIFAATGILFLAAAWRVEFATAGGMRAALATLAAVPLADSILFAVAIGVTLYMFSLVKAWLDKPVP